MHSFIEYISEQEETNRSFQWAFDWICKNPGDHELVHGIIIDPDTDEKTTHAWIETAADVVLDFYLINDPEFKFGLKTKDFYTAVSPTNVKKYSHDAAKKEMEQSKHHGPWHM